jgi:hypothetical protein
MSDSNLDAPEPALAEDRMDEDDRLKPEFVRAVMDRVDAATYGGRARSGRAASPGRHRRPDRGGRRDERPRLPPRSPT